MIDVYTDVKCEKEGENGPKTQGNSQKVQGANGLKPMIVSKIIDLGQVGQKANSIGFGPKA